MFTRTFNHRPRPTLPSAAPRFAVPVRGFASRRIQPPPPSAPVPRAGERFELPPVWSPREHNGTGLPNHLKSGIESLSGLSLDDVKVHYDSSKPAQLNALAYTRGRDIFVAPGQDQHLPHEAWHVVQQAQGRVPATQIQEGVAINDHEGLEYEADVVGMKALQRRTALLPAMQALQLCNNTVQLLAMHAGQFIEENGLGITATFDEVSDYVTDKSNPIKLRRGLLHAWNKPSRKGKQSKRIAEPDDLKVSGGLPVLGKRLTRSDSFESANLDYSKALSDRASTKKICVSTQEGQKADVPLFESMPDVTRLVRGFGQTFSTSSTKTGPQFALNLGPNFGLFDAPRGNDVVYIPLTKGSTSGEFYRKGGIFDWSTHAKEAQEGKMDIEEVKKTVEGSLAPNSEMVLSTAGAMVCDAKTSITGFLEYLTSFSTSKEKDVTKFFSSDPKHKPIWAPSVKGGRSLPQKLKETLQETYRGEIQARDLLYANNCLINAIALAAGKPKATEDQLVSIRIESNSLGEMLLASDDTINLIRKILGIPNRILVHYLPPTPTETFAGSDPVLHIYHNGVNHFSNVPDKNKTYSP